MSSAITAVAASFAVLLLVTARAVAAGSPEQLKSLMDLAARALQQINNQIVSLQNQFRGTAEPVVSGREGLKTLKVIDAVKRAAKSGDLVSV